MRPTRRFDLGAIVLTGTALPAVARDQLGATESGTSSHASAPAPPLLSERRRQRGSQGRSRVPWCLRPRHSAGCPGRGQWMRATWRFTLAAILWTSAALPSPAQTLTLDWATKLGTSEA